MKTLPLSEVKAQLSKIVDTVYKFDDEVVITKNGRAAAILISPAEYESWKETNIIKSDKEFMKEVQRSLKLFKRNARIYTLEELMKD